MKVRIANNKIRYRLKQQEVELFSKSGVVTETLSFGDEQEERLRFSLLIGDVQYLDVSFKDHHITIIVPETLAAEWTTTERVSFEAVITKTQNRTISVLVEKDFMCLDGREEDNEGSYPNPLAGKE